MEPINAVIIEDEARGLNNLKNMLAEYCPLVKIIAEGSSINEGLEIFSDPTLQPDVAFMDISLPDGLVFDLIDQLRPIQFDIIFVTAFDEYAIKACEFSSIGYIIKPIDPDVLIEAVNRIHPKSNELAIDERMEFFTKHYNNPNVFQKLSISALDGIYFVNIGEIVRFEAEDNYTHIFMGNGEKITASKTIKSYEDLLGPYNFYRVHKSHVINLNYMRKFVKGDGGYLVMDDGMKIEVSRRRRPAFMEQMRKLQGGF